LTTDLTTLSDNLLKGDRRALARAITVAETGGSQATELSKRLFGHSSTAHLIGVTGSPGVGKSTLVDALITNIRKAGLTVGVLAIDPTSPFTGGAILGDRIRMQGHTLDRGVFIRSMANRGHVGGVSLATYDAVRMLEASGFNIVIIETVGVGQSELAIAKTADTTILTLMPGSGDDVQAIKSGIMEIGDIYVINKGDLPGASKAYSVIVQSLELTAVNNEWRPPVLIASAETGDGTDKVWLAITQHKDFLESSGTLVERRKAKIQAELSEIIAAKAKRNFQEGMSHSGQIQALLQEVLNLSLDPHSAADRLMTELLPFAQK
jgi:LAO/AO transport system kinase